MDTSPREPYGAVDYADPGYTDGTKKYPIDTAEHARAAWDYIHKAKNAAEYSPGQLQRVRANIANACVKFGIKTSG